MNRKAYDAVDGEWGANGEAFLRQYFRSCGYHANKHPHGVYKEDIEYVSETERFYADVERRSYRTWRGTDWLRYPTLNILARRKVSPGTLFFTLSAELTKAYVSFPEDLELVRPVLKDNVHVKGELIREHEILRCLPLDLTQPIDGSIAQMNANRVRQLVASGSSYTYVMRALRGIEPYGFGAPYGMDDDEWIELIHEVEARSGLAQYASRKADVEKQQFLWD